MDTPLPTLRKLRASEAVKASPFEGYTAWGVGLHTAYWKYRGLVLLAKAFGVAAHDLYHTAQIRNMGVKGF